MISFSTLHLPSLCIYICSERMKNMPENHWHQTGCCYPFSLYMGVNEQRGRKFRRKGVSQSELQRCEWIQMDWGVMAFLWGCIGLACITWNIVYEHYGLRRASELINRLKKTCFGFILWWTREKEVSEMHHIL